jgi:hypothetical protein
MSIKEPLTLTLSRRERELIGGCLRCTPTCDCFTESIIEKGFVLIS